MTLCLTNRLPIVEGYVVRTFRELSPIVLDRLPKGFIFGNDRHILGMHFSLRSRLGNQRFQCMAAPKTDDDQASASPKYNPAAPALENRGNQYSSV